MCLQACQRFTSIVFQRLDQKDHFVPVHGGKDLKKGTFLAILKQAGIDKNEL
jgi:predicted RNA binding protein YcfA (HicA-like mRNA interferase family)